MQGAAKGHTSRMDMYWRQLPAGRPAGGLCGGYYSYSLAFKASSRCIPALNRVRGRVAGTLATAMEGAAKRYGSWMGMYWGNPSAGEVWERLCGLWGGGAGHNILLIDSRMGLEGGVQGTLATTMEGAEGQPIKVYMC